MVNAYAFRHVNESYTTAVNIHYRPDKLLLNSNDTDERC